MLSEQQPRPQDVEILIAEDSPTQAEKLRYLVEQAGYRTRMTTNGSDALASLKESPASLVLSDIVMPQMDGYTLCRAIKANAQLEHIPVILLTTLADPKDIIEGLNCGADNFIRKPYEADHLLARIQHVLVNQALRKLKKSGGVGIEIFLAGQRHFINSERQQILDLLISTFEQAVRVNSELKEREQQISDLNVQLARHASKLELLNLTLAEKNIELENASQAKLRFFAQMSHELRTPLNAVIGFSDILSSGASGALNNEQLGYVRSILNSGEYLLSLINDTLDLAKIEAGKMDLQPDHVNVRELLQDSLPMVSEQASARHVQLQLTMDDSVDTAWLDGRKVTQIALNLLSNAIKFTPEGGHVSLSGEIVTRNPINQENGPINQENGEWLHIAVRDTGIGIAPEDISKLFRSFEQVTTQHQTKGTGLGLALVKQLAELHGGNVSVESEVNRGSCFHVYLPLKINSD